MKKILSLAIISTVLLLYSCSKEWLEEKQDIKLIVPKTLEDLDLLMNESVFQYDGRGASETSCDDYEFTVEQFNQLSFGFDRDFIIWNKERDIENQSFLVQDEWNIAYNQIEVCNVVLKALSNIERNSNNRQKYDRIRGSALFFRAKQFLNLAMTFCNDYDASSAKSSLGIPLKLDEDIDEKIVRSDLQETYQKIIDDLTQATSLVSNTPRDLTQISKAGAFGLLARTYLYMDKFEAAKIAADSSLKYNMFIEDFNQLNNVSSTDPLDIRSKEMHLIGWMVKATQNGTIGRIATNLYDQYDNDDLRKTLFFRNESDGKVTFKGSFSSRLFTGTTTGEIMLISAECKARLNDKAGALNSLNNLLIKRWKTGKFIPLSAIDNTGALDLVIRERRKELVSRGLRWQDLKRLNKEARYSVTLSRTIGPNTYTLPPNDFRYALPIPRYIINYSGMQQNPY